MRILNLRGKEFRNVCEKFSQTFLNLSVVLIVFQAIALGEGWAAIATDFRNIRLFTIAGVQKEIFSVPGPVVCMVGSTSQLLIIYHRAMGRLILIIRRRDYVHI